MLILENPGSIRVGKYQMKIGGESDPRNKALMKLFNLIDIGERAGSSGVPELFAVWQQEGWEEPQIEERQDSVERTIVTLSFKKKAAEKSDEKTAEKNRRKKPYCNMRQSYQLWSLKNGIGQTNFQIF